MKDLDSLAGRVEELQGSKLRLETDILAYFYHMCRLRETARAASLLDPALFSGQGRDLAQAMLECFGRAVANGTMVLRSTIDDVLARDGKSYDTARLGPLSDMAIPGIETLRVRVGELRDAATRLAKCEVLAEELHKGIIEQGGTFSPDISGQLSGAEVGNPLDSRVTPGVAGEILEELISEHSDPDRLRFRYGYDKLDDFTGGGMYRGGLNVVMARPGERKTQFMTNVLANTLRAGQGRRVVVFSLEMPKKRIYFRTLLAASGTGRDPDRYLNPRKAFESPVGEDAREKMDRVSALFGSTEVDMLDMNDFEMNINSIVAWLERQCTAGREPDLVMLDYFQIIPPDPALAGRQDHERLADTSRQLTGFCNRHPGCAFLLLAQARRGDGKEKRVYPLLDDVAGCDQLARDAWQVITLFRGRGGDCGLEVVKNRDGSTGYAHLYVMSEQQKLDIDGDFRFGSPLPGMFDSGQECDAEIESAHRNRRNRK